MTGWIAAGLLVLAILSAGTGDDDTPAEPDAAVASVSVDS